MRIADRFRSLLSWPPLSARSLKVIAGIAAFLVLAYYPIGMAIVHKVDDDLTFPRTATETDDAATPPGTSKAVAVAAALIDREVRENRWVANDPFFLPGAALDNMPNFQQGVISGLARFAFELVDQLGRTRGSSRTDPDLQEAAGLLQYSGTKWWFDFSTSLAPVATSEAQYLRARDSLASYNARLAGGDAVFDRRADNLLATLDRVALDLGSLSAALDDEITEGRGFVDPNADDLFYNVKGHLYAYHAILEALSDDFSIILNERDLGAIWGELMKSLRLGAEMEPFVVVNGAPDGVLLPNHLAAQGFYLLRARTQLREITDILLK